MKILFVCMGNICRSPTAEGVMAKLLALEGLADRIALDSAGTGSWHAGELADPRTREAARRRGIDLVHRARQITSDDPAKVDLILVMDRANHTSVSRIMGPHAAKLRMFRSFDPAAPDGAEVPDPYSGGAAGFEEVLDQCERACLGILAYAKTRL